MGSLDKIEELEIENQLLRTIIDSIHEGVFVTNKDGKIILYNREVEKTEGMKREDVLEKTEDVVYSFSPEYYFHEAVTKKVIKTGKPITEQYYKYHLTDGRKINILFSTYPFTYKGNVTAVYTVGRNVEQIGDFIARTLEMQKKIMREDNPQNLGAKYLLEDIVGNSSSIRDALLLTRKIASHKSPVLIVGETGTGKEIFAHGIHNASLFAKGPFVPVNCAAIPETLLESILFGSVKGAFTGAVDIPGLFEQAEDGTIFLDEINSMPFSLQSKLLRVLQEKTIRRIGSNNEIPINCRIISATNIDPIDAVNKKIIRADLFFRLATVAINIPPLRERKEDLKILSMYFIKRYNLEFGLFVKSISRHLITVFEKYTWPGNVRELENIIESSMNLIESNETTLKIEHIPGYFRERIFNEEQRASTADNGAESSEISHISSLREALLQYEKKLIEESLKRHKGHITKAAQDLGIWRQNLHYRIKRFGIALDKTEN
ncbi:MAG: sigma 54-interacting transcriptional regulator [Dehalobacterium sp.]